MLLPCAVKRYGVPVGVNPTRQTVAPAGSNRSSCTGSEAAEAFDVRVTLGGLASMQAVTRVNAEQVSKDLMRKPTRR